MPATLRVLLVEDSEDDATLLLRELSRSGWDVSHKRVDSTAAMTQALQTQPWDIVISDYAMPQFDGVAALSLARQHDRDLPFILVSGTVGEEAAVHAMKAGASDYLFKGNLTRLAPAVQRELREAQTRREAQRIEQELQKRDSQLAEAQRLAHLGTWHFDLRMNSAVWSDEADRILGMGNGHVAGTVEEFLKFFHLDDRNSFSQHLHSLSATNIAQDYRVECPDGTARFVHLRGDIVRAPDGTAIEAAGMVLDITERKLAEYALRNAHNELALAKEVAESANRAKDDFLAVLSHELRTPLTPVLLTVSLLENSDKLTQDMQTDIQTIRKHVELEARLIDDLLDLTRISRGKLQLNFETADIHLMLRAAMEITCADRMQDITLELEAQYRHVRADPARLQQIFWNLLSNAIKFTPSGRSILIRSSNPDANKIRVEVIDAGIGIETSALPRIFNAFEQADSSLTRNFGGLGLGLTITRTLVEAHSGTIEARSDGPNTGATFIVEMPTTVSLPARPLKPVRRPPPPSAETTRPVLRILLVEDHPGTLALMTKLLSLLGHEVKSASTVKDALTLAEQAEFNLVISDLGLPDGSGHDLMRLLKERYDVQGIAVSGFGMDEDIRKSMEAGFSKHLIKPINLEKLQAAIQQTVPRS